jgi:hypothetical protein
MLWNRLNRPLSRMSNMASTIAAVVAVSIVLFPIVSAQDRGEELCALQGRQNSDGSWKSKSCFCRSFVTCRTCHQSNPCSPRNKEQGENYNTCSNCVWTVCASGSQGYCRSANDRSDFVGECKGRRVIWPHYADMCFFEEPGHIAGVVIGVFAIINAAALYFTHAKYFDDKTRRKWCLLGLLLPVVSNIIWCYINRDKLAAIEEERKAKRKKAIEEARQAEIRNPPVINPVEWQCERELRQFEVELRQFEGELRNAQEHRQFERELRNVPGNSNYNSGLY